MYIRSLLFVFRHEEGLPRYDSTAVALNVTFKVGVVGLGTGLKESKQDDCQEDYTYERGEESKKVQTYEMTLSRVPRQYWT